MKRTLLPFVFLLAFYCTVSGQVWEPKAVGVLPANFGIDDISIVNEQVIWATANDYSVSTPVPASHVSKLIKSTDGGETWKVADIEEATGRFCWDIHAFDENTACITTTNQGSGNKRGIFRTTDGGTTWVEVFNHPAGDLWLHFFDGQEGVCGSGEDIARTVNGGATWMPVPPANIPNLMTGEGIGGASLSNGIGTSSNSVWFGTSKGRVFKTADRGQNWTAHSTGLGANSFLYSFGFIDEKNGLGIFDISGISELAKTTNGGITWEKTGNFDFTIVDAIPCANTFIGASFNAGNEITSFSTNHGETWTARDTSLAANSHIFLNPEIGWTANSASIGTGPALYKWNGGTLDTRIYVNQNATGANNGSAWADAYTDLQSALAAATAGDEIWVAEGTYKPAAPGGSQNATFLINKDLKLYGGFAGTECNLSERDVLLHSSVLSGDLNGNDVDDDFSPALRNDNVSHVVSITAAATLGTVVDGLTIQGGQADGSLPSANGGGITCLGAPSIRKCVFRQNFCFRGGAGLHVSGIGAQGLVVEHCRFEKNLATHPDGNASGGGMAVWTVKGSGFDIRDCEFVGNKANWAGGLDVFNSNGSAEGVKFTDNNTPRQGGGLLITTYSGNNGLNFTVQNCIFESNKASFGGGLHYLNFSPDCTFDITGCKFIGNSVEPMMLPGWDQESGGLDIAFALGANNCSVSIDSCLFEGNTSSQSGGGLGIYSEANSTYCKITHCTLSRNHAAKDAGGFVLWGDGENLNIEMNACRFIENQSADAGGAIRVGSIFSNSPTTASVLFENCLIAGNTSTAATIAADSMPSLTFINSTIASNSGGGIQLSDKSGLALQNTILYNPGYLEYEALSNDVTFTSNGGNLIGDLSLNGQLLPSDKENLDPVFVGAGDYHLGMGSPGLNKGVDLGNLSALDLDGHARVVGSAVDIGAYEDQTVAVQELMAENLMVSPNPADVFLTVQLPEEITGPFVIEVYNSEGKRLRSQTLIPGQRLDVQGFVPGTYALKALWEERVYAGKFVKQ